MMYKKLSNGISWVLHPFLLPLYLIVVLLTLTVFAHYPANVKFYLLWVVVLYAMIIPLLALGVLRSLGRISDFKVDNRRERLLPLLVGAIPFGIIFGSLAVSAGLTPWQTVGMSLLVFAGSAQLAALPLIAAGAPIWYCIGAAC